MPKLNSVGILLQIKTTAMTSLLVIFKHIIKHRWLVHYQIGKKKKQPKKSLFLWKGHAKYIEQTKVWGGSPPKPSTKLLIKYNTYKWTALHSTL